MDFGKKVNLVRKVVENMCKVDDTWDGDVDTSR